MIPVQLTDGLLKIWRQDKEQTDTKLALQILHCDLILQPIDQAATTKWQTRVLPWRQIFNMQPKLSRPQILQTL
jgi:hypothetical protein